MNKKTLLAGILALSMAFGTFGAVGCFNSEQNSSGNTNTGSGTGSSTDTSTGSGTGSGTDTNTDTSTDTNTNTGTGNNTENNTGTGDSTDTNTNTDSNETKEDDTVAVTGVTLSHSTYSLTVGGSVALTANISPTNATNSAVSWTTSNSAVATVSGGTVTAVGAGTATITVTTSDGAKTATCIVTVTAAATGEATISYSYGGYESAAFEWADSNPTGATVKYKKDSETNYTTLDSELVRSASTSGYARADVVGLQGGATYNFIITTSSGDELTTTQAITAYDRSGYAHFNYTSGVGAYNDDGTLKSGATVVYVTESNKNNVDGNGKSIAEYLSSAKNNSSPIVIRVIGTVGSATWNEIDYNENGTYSSSNHILAASVVGVNNQQLPTDSSTTQADLISGGYNTLNYYPTAYNGAKCEAIDGLNSKIKYTAEYIDKNENTVPAEYDSCWNDCSVQNLSNVTVEGIGEDAKIFQWGFTWKNCNSIEVRNLTFEDYTEDACSFEGSDTSATSLSDFTKSKNIWVHSNTFEEGINYWDVCAEQDKHEGDGGTDFKGVAYVTLSYNVYHENHKTGLIGGGDSQTTACVTFHHNYYNQCQSRLPLARQANLHMYNNYYYGSTGTNMSLRAGAYALIENCYFENANNPIEIKTTTSTSGAAKLCGNVFSGKQYTASDYIYVVDRDATVTNYNVFSQDFDTNSSVFYYDSTNKCSNVTVMLTAAETKEQVPKLAGVQKRNGTVISGNSSSSSSESSSGNSSGSTSSGTESGGSTVSSASVKADDYTAGDTFTTATNDLFTLANTSSSAVYTITALESAGGSTTASASDSSGLTFSSALLPNGAQNVSMMVTATKAISITIYYTVSDSGFNKKEQTKSGYLQWAVNGGTTQSDTNTANKAGRTAYAVTISLSAGDSVVLTPHQTDLLYSV